MPETTAPTFAEALQDLLAGEDDYDTQAQLRDLASHGASTGWPGLTYYSDTGALYERYEDEIWAALDDDADSMGEPSALALVATFGGARDVSTDAQFRNLLVWYMAEREARRLADL
jgi:hypothetical protein